VIDATLEHVTRNGIPAERFEFQMLFGVRRDLQQELVGDGWNVRVYVPFGEQWYPYLMRRLAERPANMLLLAGKRRARIAARLPVGRTRPHQTGRHDEPRSEHDASKVTPASDGVSSQDQGRGAC
jgi:hypothetical protein